MNEVAFHHRSIPLGKQVVWSVLFLVALILIAPPALAHLQVSSSSSSSVTLTWTAPGDDGSMGTASQYDVRYSTSPITEANWGSAQQATGEGTPQPAGSIETFIVTGLTLDSTYYFAIKTADEVPNWSPLSNVVSASAQNDYAPSVPVHVSPLNGDTVTSAPITLTVNNATDLDGDTLTYSFWVAADPGFTQVVATALNVAEGSNQTSATLSSFSPTNGQQYWWRCRANDGQLNSDYSSAWTFWYADISTGDECQTPPGVPVALSPIDSSDGGSLQPQLCVANSTPAPGCLDPQVYIFEVYTDQYLTIPVISPDTINESNDSTCYTVPTPLGSGRYYWWRVRCFNGTAVSGWAGPYVFHTPNTLPPPPTAAEPGNGDTVLTRVPQLSVNAVADPDGTPLVYIFEVSRDSNFSTLASSGQISGGAGIVSWTVIDALHNDMPYYWRARVTDGIGYSGYTAVRSFYVQVENNTAPTAPVVQSPPDGSTVDTLMPTLIVLNGTDSDGDLLTYEFELYDQAATTLLADTSGIDEGVTATSWTVPVILEDSAIYNWRVRCFDGQEYSPWTSLTEFTVDLDIEVNNPPSLPVHVSPTDGSTIIATPVMLVIQNSIDPEGDPIRYDFWIYSDSLLTQVVESKLDVPQTPFQTATICGFAPVNGHRYWWHVRAKDSTSTTAATVATWFEFSNTAMGGDEYTAGIAQPTDGAVVLTDRPQLKAVNIAVSGSSFYYFEVATDSNFVSLVSASSPIPEQEGDFTEWRVDEQLETGREYYWRVRANNYAYSPVARFVVGAIVYASPNPVHLGEVVMFHLPEEPVDLLVQTVSGETVIIKEGIAGEWDWDLRNASGYEVAVGIYLWYVAGTNAHGKVVVKP
jgi:hypothetical protein